MSEPGLRVCSVEEDEEGSITLASFTALLRLEMNESCREGSAKSTNLPGILPPRFV